MVDIPSAWTKRRSRMFVPIEKIEREGERIGISTILRSTFERLGKKLAFSRRKGFEKGSRNVRTGIFLPGFRTYGEIGGRRVDFLFGRVGEVFEAEDSVLNRISASKPKTAGLTIARNRFRTFQLPIDFRKIRFGNLESPNVAKFFVFRFFPKFRHLEIGVFESVSNGGTDFVRLPVCGQLFRRGKSNFSRLPPREPEHWVLARFNHFGRKYAPWSGKGKPRRRDFWGVSVFGNADVRRKTVFSGKLVRNGERKRRVCGG